MTSLRRPALGRLHWTLSLISILAACSSEQDPAASARALRVGVAQVERMDVPLFVEMVGATLGTQDVPIRARVEGFLETMSFVEGTFVSQGDPLYTIDPQPFQAKLVEAQSFLAAAQTTHVRTQSDLARIRPLAEMDAVSQQDLDSAVAQEAAASASVRASEAQVELAEIELSYTRITAPITGLIGLSQAKPGEFVGREPNPVVLNVLSDIDPIRVRFSISEREYLELTRTYLQTADRLRDRNEPRNNLVLLLADGSEHPHRGTVVATAQSINPETGTYSVEASFPNPNNILLPGQFARVRAPYRTLENATVVPRRAIVELQGRYQVFVVGNDNTVEVRAVEIGPVMGTVQVVESGVEEGETIVVEGVQRVRAGALVDPQPYEISTPVATAENP